MVARSMAMLVLWWHGVWRHEGKEGRIVGIKSGELVCVCCFSLFGCIQGEGCYVVLHPNESSFWAWIYCVLKSGKKEAVVVVLSSFGLGIHQIEKSCI